MNSLQKQVFKARRWLTGQKFLQIWTWTLFSCLLVSAILVGVDARYHPWGQFRAEVHNAWWYLGGGLALGTVVGLVITFCTRPKVSDAALELDKRFGLKERVSSALAMPPDVLETPAGRALIEDAAKRVEKVEVSERFGLQVRPVTLLPLLPVALALGLAFLPAMMLDESAQAKTTDPNFKSAEKKPITKLVREIKLQKPDPQENGLKEAPEWMKNLEKGVKELSEKKELSHNDALKEINNLSQKLEQRRNELGNSDKVKEQLENRLKDLQQGPGDKFAKALGKGDFNKAMQELNKMKEQLKNGEMDDKAKEELANQMQQIQEKLQQLADAHENMKKNLEQQIDQARKNGQLDQAEKMLEQLKQMKQGDPQMQQLQKLAEQLGQCKECMKQGDMQQAMEALQQMQGELEQMAQNEAEMQMLQDAMDKLGECKNGMCQGLGQKEGNKPGNGLGKGRGQGERPEEEEATNTYDTRVNPKLDTKGKATFGGLVEGQNVAGDAQQQINTEIRATQSGTADPLTDLRLPRNQRDHVGDYFNQLRKQ